MGARYYNPIAGRFLSIDPQSVTTDNIHGFNRYAYANNNPYRYVDPDGRMPLLALLAFPSAGAAMVQATVDAAVIVGSVYAMIHGNGGDDAGKGSSPANGSSQGDPNNGKGLNKALGAAGVAKGGSSVISKQKQAGHIQGTPQHANRIKQGKPTSSFFGENSGERLIQQTFNKGKPVPGRPNVREHDFGVSTGTGPNGGMQTRVRVHQDSKGSIHGHPSGPERF